MIWWILLFGVSLDGKIERFAFLQAPPDAVTYEDCQAGILTLNVSLSQRGGLAACRQAPTGVDVRQLLGTVILVPG
jgi:hypothetical protein